MIVSELSGFFKASSSSLGLGNFYPLHDLISTFPHYSAARDAERALRDAGYLDDEMAVATGAEALEFFKDFREDAGLWGAAMRSLSNFLGGESLKTEKDMEHAGEGAGFVAIHCPTEEKALEIMKMIQPYSPTSADWYQTGGIRSFLTA